MLLNLYAIVEIHSMYSHVLITKLSKNQFYIIAAEKVRTQGYLNGKIVDDNAFLTFINQTIKMIDSKYKIQIDEIILVAPAMNHQIHRAGATISIQTSVHLIGPNEITRIRQDCRHVRLNEGELAIEEIPIQYTLDSGKVVYQAPINVQSTTLMLTSFIHTLPTTLIESLVVAFDQFHIDVLEVYLSSFACYNAVESMIDVSQMNLIIHYDYDALTFSLFKDNQLLKTSQLPFGEKDVLQSLMKDFGISEDEALDVLDSYFIIDKAQTHHVPVDANQLISEKTVHTSVIKIFEMMFEHIRITTMQYQNAYISLPLHITLTGKWLNYGGFINYFNSCCKFDAKPGMVEKFGLASNEFITTYGAFLRFIAQNKDFILDREEQEPQKVNFNVKKSEQTKTQAMNNSKFVDIFDED